MIRQESEKRETASELASRAGSGRVIGCFLPVELTAQHSKSRLVDIPGKKEACVGFRSMTLHRMELDILIPSDNNTDHKKDRQVMHEHLQKDRKSKFGK